MTIVHPEAVYPLMNIIKSALIGSHFLINLFNFFQNSEKFFNHEIIISDDSTLT